MSPEEINRIAIEEMAQEELQAEESQAQGGYAPENTAPSKEEMDQYRSGTVPKRFEDQGLEVEESTIGESAAAAATGAPFVRDALAIAERMNEGVDFGTAYDSYKPNLEEMNIQGARAKKDNPWTYGATEVGTLVAGTMAGAATLAPALGGTLTTAGLSTVAGVGMGTLEGLSSSKDRGVKDAAKGAAWGIVGEVGGHYVGKGLKKTGEWLMDAGGDMVLDTVKKTLGLGGRRTKNIAFDNHLQRTGQKEVDFLDNISSQEMSSGVDKSGNKIMERVIDLNDSPERMLSKIKTHKKSIGDEIGNGYKAIDEAHDIKIDVAELKNDLRIKVVNDILGTSDNPSRQKIAAQVVEFIDNIGVFEKSTKMEYVLGDTKKIVDMGMEKTWNLSRVHKLQVDIRDTLSSIYKHNGSDITTAKQQEARVASALGRQMDQILDSVSTKADDVVSSVKANRVRFGNMATVEEGLQDSIYGASKGGIENTIKEVFGSGNVATAAARGAVIASQGGAGFLASIPVLGQIAKSTKTPAYIAKGLDSIGNIIAAAPTGRISTRLTAASMLSSREFSNALNGTIAEINLRAEPLQRNSENVQARQEDIRNLLKDRQPESIADFDKVIQEGPAAIGVFMDTISKLPGVSELFEPGVGFDGKVYSKEDKRALIDEVRRSNISRHDALQKAKEVELTGKIPDIRDVTPRPQQIYTPKNNRKVHKY